MGIARADFLERSRRPGFLVTMAVTLYAAYVFLPPNHASYATFQFGGHRGIYNSAWVGSAVSLLAAVFLSMVGFYVVKNAVAGDRRARVGPLLAATPMSKQAYVWGKALSNLAILIAIVGLLIMGAAVMQWIRGEDRIIAPLSLIVPFLLVTLPVMTLVSAIAVLFEVVPGLRGGWGNVAWFIVWSFGLAQSALRGSSFDLLGVSLFTPSMIAACQRAFPGYHTAKDDMSLGIAFKSSGHWDLQTFRWDGVEWTPGMIGSRLMWLALSFAICLLSAWLFDRFDTAEVAAKPARRGGSRAASVAARAPARGVVSTGSLTPLSGTLDLGIARLLVAELRLLLRGIRLPWLVVTAGLIVASLLAPRAAVARGILPALWILPLFLWSSLGNREAVHGVEDLLRSTPRPVVRPLLAQWGSGAVLALAMAIGGLVRWIAAGDFVAAYGAVAGAAFVPALAVALGAWSRSSKLFEVIYLLLWYAGPLNRAPGLDFTGAESTPASATIWLLLAFAFMASAIATRRRA